MGDYFRFQYAFHACSAKPFTAFTTPTIRMVNQRGWLGDEARRRSWSPFMLSTLGNATFRNGMPW